MSVNTFQCVSLWNRVPCVAYNMYQSLFQHQKVRLTRRPRRLTAVQSARKLPSKQVTGLLSIIIIIVIIIVMMMIMIIVMIMMIIIIMTMIMLIIIIVIIAFKVHFKSKHFTISSVCRELSPARMLKWPRAHLCANHVQHIECLSRKTCRVTCHMVGRDCSAIKFESLKSHLFELNFLGWTIKGGEETGVLWENSWRRASLYMSGRWLSISLLLLLQYQIQELVPEPFLEKKMAYYFFSITFRSFKLLIQPTVSVGLRSKLLSSFFKPARTWRQYANSFGQKTLKCVPSCGGKLPNYSGWRAFEQPKDFAWSSHWMQKKKIF